MTRSRKLLFILCTALFLSGCSGQSKDADKISKLEKQLADAKQRAEKAEQAEQEALEKLKEYEDASEDASEPEGGSSETAEDGCASPGRDGFQAADHRSGSRTFRRRCTGHRTPGTRLFRIQERRYRRHKRRQHRSTGVRTDPEYFPSAQAGA